MKKILRHQFFLLTSSLLIGGSAMAQVNGWWYRKADYPSTARSSAVGFVIGSGGHLGTGYDSSTYKRNFYVYNPSNNSWTADLSLGGSTGTGLGRDVASAFAIGNYGYVCLGQGTNPYNNDLWEYNSITNVWTQKANFGGTARRAAMSFAADNKGFVTCGQDASGFCSDTWMYDPGSNTWFSRSPFPGTARRLGVAFVVNGVAFVGTGDDGTFKKDFYAYDPINDVWSTRASFPGTPRYSAAAFVIGLNGYVGTGYDNTLQNTKDFYCYDPSGDSWTTVTSFGGSARTNAVGFGIGNYGYLATGYDTLGCKDLWEFDPLSNGIQELNKFKSSLNTWPNPMSDYANFSFDPNSLNAFDKISFSLYDLQGKLIQHTERITNSTFRIERNGLPAGTYLYKFNSGDQVLAAGRLLAR